MDLNPLTVDSAPRGDAADRDRAGADFERRVRPLEVYRPMSPEGSRRAGRLAWRAAGCAVILLAAPLRAESASPSPQGERLAREQDDIGEIVAELRKKMESLAVQIEETQPEDARLLREAATAMEVSELSKTFDVIRTYLQRNDLLEAFVRQGSVLEQLDEIITLLEDRRLSRDSFREELDSIRRQRAGTRQLIGRQRSLLEKTREVLEQAEQVGALKDLREELDRLRDQQERLGRGEDPDSIDPEGARTDDRLLGEALEEARALEQRQGRIEEGMRSLSAGPGDLARRRRFLEDLDEAIARARALAARADRLKAELAGETGPAEARETPEGGAEGSPAGEETKKELEGKRGSEGSEPGGGERPREGAGDAETARRAQDREERREAIARDSDDLSRRLDELHESVKESAPRAREPVAEARDATAEASRQLQRSSIDPARDLQRKALERLAAAREALRRELNADEQRNALETAGLAQEQSSVAKRAEDAASRWSEASQDAGGESARTALQESSDDLSEAAGKMQDALEALAGGERSAAREAGQEAGERLREARERLERAREERGQLSGAEKREELQRKLKRKTEAAADETERLERKLRRKDPQAGRKAQEAAAALRDASRAMQEAADAAQRQDSSAAARKRDEALERLDLARRAVEEEEKDRLQRLERRKLQQESGPQRDLGRETRGLSREMSAQGGGDRRQQAEGLDRAAEKMDRAAESLEREDPQGAEPDQEEALEELRRAEEEMREEEERLEELKREQEMLSMIEELGDIRKRQEAINVRTVAIHMERGAQGESRRQRLKLLRDVDPLLKEQDALSGRTRGLTKKLEEEGARVFDFMLTSVASDMDQIRDLLAEIETGGYTQFLQKEVLEDIDRLMAAIEEQRQLARKRQEEAQQRSEEDPGAPGEEGPPPLVSMTEELLMLRQLQREVNRQTLRLDDIRRAQPDSAPEMWTRAVDRLAQRQGSISRLTGEIVEDFEKAR
ncbi:MAG: hypothetical protein JXA90_09210, partial [Planctomycetes bacterium]|nr:hypothetical protein [Planctomycetota bacterium]